MVQLPNNPFSSFWMGGFECTDKLNAFGNRVDLMKITAHLDRVYEDYEALAQFNIATVREGIRWSQVEKTPYVYDWSSVEYMLRAGKHCNVQQVWDICHFGFPDDLTPLHPMFARRFAAVCSAFVQFYHSQCPNDTLIVIPINEVSFLSWLGGEACGTSPYCRNYGWQVKYNLVKAFIEGVEAMKAVDPSVRILTSEPLVNMVPPAFATPEEIAVARKQHAHQFQVLDMLAGRICPELRGREEYIDLIGLNYYYNNQWICNTGKFLVWKDEPKDARWKPLSTLVQDVYQRYGKPIVITETSHPKEDRPLWMHDITTQLITIIQNRVPLLGVCIYPIIDRPDWDDLVTWHKAGLWDIEPGNQQLERVLYKPYAAAFLQAQQRLSMAMAATVTKEIAIESEYPPHNVLATLPSFEAGNGHIAV